jgi:hypothetical protein
MDVLDVFITSGQSIARGGTLLPKGAVEHVVLVYGRLDVFVSGQFIAPGRTLWPKRTLACIVLVYGRPFAS